MRLGVTLLVIALSFGSPTAFSASSSSVRTDKPFGITFTGHGNPSPSAVGLGINYNLTSFLRLDAGIGGYSSWVNPGNWAIGIYNYAILGAVWAISYAVVWVVTAGNYKLSYGDFKDDFGIGYLPNKSIFSYGGGGTLVVPGWRFTPAVGFHYAGWSAHGKPFGLKDSGEHTYYSAGIDFQSQGGFNLQAGVNICPTNKNETCGGYGALGVFF